MEWCSRNKTNQLASLDNTMLQQCKMCIGKTDLARGYWLVHILLGVVCAQSSQKCTSPKAFACWLSFHNAYPLSRLLSSALETRAAIGWAVPSLSRLLFPMTMTVIYWRIHGIWILVTLKFSYKPLGRTRASFGNATMLLYRVMLEPHASTAAEKWPVSPG